MRSFHAVIVLPILASPALAQFTEPSAEPLHTITKAAGSFGWAVSELGDIDGDGVTDAIISQPFASTNRGRLHVHSGRTGERIFLSSGNTTGDQFSFAIADAGDTNGDSIPDLVGGAPFGANGGYVQILSGDPNATTRLLLQINAPPNAGSFGYATSSLGDVDGDGCSDVLVGAPNTPNGLFAAAGAAYICSGKDGSVLHTLVKPGTPANSSFGQGVAGVGDLDGDGISDAVVSSPGSRSAHAFSGATGTPILVPLQPEGGSSTFGQFFVGGVGDLTQDGIPDIYVGDYAAARATVFSGSDGSVHLSITGPRGSGLGCGRGLNADANGDGVPDLAVGLYLDGSAANGAGKIQIRSGTDGEVLQSVTHELAGTQLGFDVVGLGDINGDGSADFLAAAATGNIVYIINGSNIPCKPDLNQDSILDNGDISAFVQLFLQSDPQADFNGDNLLDNKDIGAVVTAFLAGCD